MKKALACLLIIAGSCIVLYSLIVLINCFTLLSSAKFNSKGIVYSLGTLIGPLLLLAISRWMIRKGVKIFKEEIALKKNK